MTQKELGRWLKERRDAQGISIYDAARRAGTAVTFFEHLEIGDFAHVGRCGVGAALIYGLPFRELLQKCAQAELKTRLEQAGISPDAFAVEVRAARSTTPSTGVELGAWALPAGPSTLPPLDDAAVAAAAAVDKDKFVDVMLGIKVPQPLHQPLKERR